jgi:hypothetical protein
MTGASKAKEVAGLTLFLTAALGFAGAPQATAPAPPAEMLPAVIRPPAGTVLLFRARAEGYQVYQCKARPDNANEFAWTLKGPDAVLFNDRGEKVGTHYAGPFWEAADGSKVRAAVKASHKAPDASAIPWLLLTVTARGGKGQFAAVKYVARVDTWAGQAPAAGCTRADVGKEVRVKYQATYLFYGDKR